MSELEKSRYTRISQLAQIVIFNAIPLFGILYLGWSAKLLILAYFLETIIAIVFHALRLWYVNYRWGNEPETKSRAAEIARMNKGQGMPASCLPLFMLVFFGFFCFVQLFVLGGFANEAFPEGIFTSMYQAAKGELAWVVLSFTFLQTVRFFMEVIRSEYAFTPSEALFFQPFRRILTQQLTVILGGFIILFAGANSYIIILVLVTIAIDLFFFFINNEKLKAFLTKGDPKAEKDFEELKKMM
ncbi:MAG: hypothetical protein GC192_03500 [Bacteroidetes bacterium]|nr:hypothetical protein [Bacteroidota bacterium]